MIVGTYPIIGERIYGPVGHGVDLLAVFGTTFGVATSLGLGVNQMATGLNVLFGVDPGVMTRILLNVGISIVATLSAVSGVGNGIRIISEWNIWLSVVLLAFFLFGGPFKWLMGFFVTSLGDYIWNLIPMGFWTAGTGNGSDLDDRIAAACRQVYVDEIGHMCDGVVGLSREDLSSAEWEELIEMTRRILRQRLHMRNEQFSYPVDQPRIDAIDACDIEPMEFDYAGLE